VNGDHARHVAIAHGDEVSILIVKLVNEFAVTGVGVLRDFAYEGSVVEQMNGFVFFFGLCLFEGISTEVEDGIVFVTIFVVLDARGIW